MLNRLFQEEEDKILRDKKRNQEIHMRSVEEATSVKGYVDPKNHLRFPHKFNRGYSYK